MSPDPEHDFFGGPGIFTALLFLLILLALCCLPGCTHYIAYRVWQKTEVVL